MVHVISHSTFLIKLDHPGELSCKRPSTVLKGPEVGKRIEKRVFLSIAQYPGLAAVAYNNTGIISA